MQNYAVVSEHDNWPLDGSVDKVLKYKNKTPPQSYFIYFVYIEYMNI